VRSPPLYYERIHFCILLSLVAMLMAAGLPPAQTTPSQSSRCWNAAPTPASIPARSNAGSGLS